MKIHYVQPGVGHYGVFNGSRWRAEICPRVGDFILTHNQRSNAAKADRERQAKPREKTVAVHDLKKIVGIGPKIEAMLHREGIFLVDQVAELTDAQVEDLEGRLGLRGRIRREDWVGQARRLMTPA